MHILGSDKGKRNLKVNFQRNSKLIKSVGFLLFFPERIQCGKDNVVLYFLVKKTKQKHYGAIYS